MLLAKYSGIQYYEPYIPTDIYPTFIHGNINGRQPYEIVFEKGLS